MLGEEFGVTGGASRRWIVDPIDGTRNYSRGIPVWATLIALEEDGVIRLGVVSAPALGRRWWAERGAGAFVERRSRSASPRVAADRGRGALLRARAAAPGDRRSAAGTRAATATSGRTCWSPRVPSTARSMPIGVKVWDLAALQPIVEEAGGRFTDRDGIARVDGLSAISSNGLLHDVLLEASRPRSEARRSQSASVTLFSPCGASGSRPRARESARANSWPGTTESSGESRAGSVGGTGSTY